MAILPEQAQDALKDQDWSLLNQYLEQLLEPEADGKIATVQPFEGQSNSWERSLSLALQVLESGDFQAQWEVAKLLPRFGETAIAPLIELLQDSEADDDARWFAARTLGGFHQPQVIPALITLLQTAETEDLRAIAAEALATQGSQAIPALTALLNQPETQLVAAQALAQIRSAETVEPLLNLAQTAHGKVRSLVLEALSGFPDPQIPPILVAALQAPDASVRRAAIQGLSVRSDLAAELNLVEQIGDRLWDLNLSVCQAAAIALGRIGNDACVERLRQTLNSPNLALPLQLELVRALAWAGSATALDSLHQMLNQPTLAQSVCHEIVNLLGRWAAADLKPKAAEILVDVLQNQQGSGEPTLRSLIALALGQLQQDFALEPLIYLLATADPSTRLHIVAALKNLDATRAQQKLAAIALQPDAPTPLKQAAAIALQVW